MGGRDRIAAVQMYASDMQASGKLVMVVQGKVLAQLDRNAFNQVADLLSSPIGLADVYAPCIGDKQICYAACFIGYAAGTGDDYFLHYVFIVGLLDY